MRSGTSRRNSTTTRSTPCWNGPSLALCRSARLLFRDGLACGATSTESIARFLAHLTVIDQTIVFTSVEVAREATAVYAEMNRDWWASPTEAYIYNEFADALRESLRIGLLHKDDLFRDDAAVMAVLQASDNPIITEKLDHIIRFRPERLEGYTPESSPRPAGSTRRSWSTPRTSGFRNSPEAGEPLGSSPPHL